MFDVIVLAGGGARRLGGIDKPALDVGGVSLLDRVLDAAVSSGAVSVVVVGPERPTTFPVVWTREEPPGGGPVPSLAAGLAHSASPWVVVLAADLPFLDVAAIKALLEDIGSSDGVVYVDASGKRQPLVAAYRRQPLAAALDEVAELDGARLWDVVGRLALRRIDDTRGVTADCDTWDRVESARRLLASSQGNGENEQHGRHT
jgi:molybdopterin-guanine dinucleotide biosynthesis protein A